MEDFEEISPQNEFSDYINLQKEIKRLNEENGDEATRKSEDLLCTKSE